MSKLKAILSQALRQPIKIKSRTPEYSLARQGVKKGYLVKDGELFAITEEGKKYLETPSQLEYILEQSKTGFISSREYSRMVSYAVKQGWLQWRQIKGFDGKNNSPTKRYKYTLTQQGKAKLKSLKSRG